jgi:hypothetical protein
MIWKAFAIVKKAKLMLKEICSLKSIFSIVKSLRNMRLIIPGMSFNLKKS